MWRWAVALLILLALALGALFWRTQGESHAKPALPAATDRAKAEASESSAAPAELASAPIARTESPAEATPATKLDDRARVSGTIELPDGSPLAGFPIKLLGREGNRELVAEFGLPKDWSDPTTTTDSNGRFEVRFDPPPAYQFILFVETKGQAKLSWRWVSMKRGEVKDLGVVRFPPTGTIEGRILDAAGNPVTGEWGIYIESACATKGDGGEAPYFEFAANPATATFRCEAIPAGAASVSARTKSKVVRASTGRVNAEVKAGQIAHADLLFAPSPAEDNSRRIRVNATCAAFRGLGRLAPGSVVLLGLAATPTPAIQSASYFGPLQFENVPQGEYTIELRDPAFQPWSKSGVKPGDFVEMPLVGSSGVQLTVRRRDDASVIDAYRLRVQVEKASFSPNDFEMRRAGAPAPAGSVYRGFVAHSYRLIEEAEGLPSTPVRVEDLLAGEVRAVEVALDKGAKVRGRVLAGGDPAARAAVTVFEEGAPRDDRSTFGGAKDPSAREMTTGDDGAFEFGPLAPGRFEVEAAQGKDVKSGAVPFEIVSGGTDVVIDLTLPGTGGLIGIVKSRDGKMSFAGLEVAAVAVPKDSKWTDAERLEQGCSAVFVGNKSAKGKIDVAGTFLLEALPEGECDVWLKLPDAVFDASPSHTSSVGVLPTRLGTARITADKTVQQTFELSDDGPGALRLEVTVNGEPAADALVMLSALPDAKGDVRSLGGVKLDASGDGTMGPMPSVVGRIAVRGPGDLWFACWPNEVRAIAGSETRLRLPLTFGSAELAFVDAKDKKPLVNWSAGLTFGNSTSFFTETDAHGVLRLGLGPGEYVVTIAKPGGTGSPGKSIHIVWPPASGTRLEIPIE